MTSNISSQILNDFTALLAAKGLSSEQQKQIASQLDQAVALNLIGRLENELSVEQKNELAARKPNNIQDVLKFLSEKISAAKVQEVLKVATETVVEKFLDRT